MIWPETGIGIDIVAWIQSSSTGVVDTVSILLHYAGGQYAYFVILPIVYWCIDKEGGKRLLIVTLATALLNIFLKELLAQPRPFELAPERVTTLVEQHGFGFLYGWLIG